MTAFLGCLAPLRGVVFFPMGSFFLPPPASMLEQMSVIPPAFRIFLGVAEVLAAIGLTLPGITRIQPWWISWAAAGLMIVMISATIFHIIRGEVSSAITTFILLVMATFVAYMRWKVKPILPRTVA